MSDEVGGLLEGSTDKLLESSDERCLFDESEALFSAQQGDELADNEQQLCEYISEVLWRNWDPIGVNNISECRDEYYAYEDGVYLFSKYAPLQLSDYLQHLQSTNLGIEGDENKENCEEIAQKISLKSEALGVGLLTR